jgi:hypothetical protein
MLLDVQNIPNLWFDNLVVVLLIHIDQQLILLILFLFHLIHLLHTRYNSVEVEYYEHAKLIENDLDENGKEYLTIYYLHPSPHCQLLLPSLD